MSESIESCTPRPPPPSRRHLEEARRPAFPSPSTPPRPLSGAPSPADVATVHDKLVPPPPHVSPSGRDGADDVVLNWERSRRRRAGQALRRIPAPALLLYAAKVQRKAAPRRRPRAPSTVAWLRWPATGLGYSLYAVWPPPAGGVDPEPPSGATPLPGTPPRRRSRRYLIAARWL